MYCKPFAFDESLTSEMDPLEMCFNKQFIVVTFQSSCVFYSAHAYILIKYFVVCGETKCPYILLN